MTNDEIKELIEYYSALAKSIRTYCSHIEQAEEYEQLALLLSELIAFREA